MFNNNGYYQTSNDYKKLFELLCEGQTVICLVDDYECGKKTVRKELCKANRLDEFDINFGTPGICYISVLNYEKKKNEGKSEFEVFELKCKESNVEWIINGNSKFDGTHSLSIDNITLGCISEEAKDLLEKICDEYKKHYQSGQKSVPKLKFTRPDTAYGPFYWLVRWSGLIRSNR